MTTHIKSINRKVWKVVETKIEIEDLENPTAAEEVLLQNNDNALSVIHDVIDERTFEQIKNIEMTHEAWKKLEESFEGTKAIKGVTTPRTKWAQIAEWADTTVAWGQWAGYSGRGYCTSGLRDCSDLIL
jgi:hypothetical protein